MTGSVISEDMAYITGHDLPWERFRNKTVLVSGAAGFLPAYMIETLLHLNQTRDLNIRVVGLVRDLTKAKRRFARHSGPLLNLVPHDVCEAIALAEPVHFIIHAASYASPKYFRIDPVGTIMPNVAGTANLLNLGRDKRIESFLFFSTSGVYGHVDASCFPIKEDCYGALDPLDVASCYLESKRMGETLCVAWQHQYGIPVKIVRPAITFGPGVALDDGRSFADFIARIVNGQDIELYSDGMAVRNFCYIADATTAFFMVMMKGQTGQAYNVASDQEISILDLARKLTGEIFPEKGLKVVMRQDSEKNFFRIPFPRTTVDISKMKALGWNLNFTIEEGFRRTVRSIMECKGDQS
jgi:nucleoside-diphosphate-sugar epimerase